MEKINESSKGRGRGGAGSRGGKKVPKEIVAVQDAIVKVIELYNAIKPEYKARAANAIMDVIDDNGVIPACSTNPQ